MLEIEARNKTIAWFYSFIGLEFAFAGAMRGAGASVAPMVTSFRKPLPHPDRHLLAVVRNDYMGLLCNDIINGDQHDFDILYYLKGNWRNKTVAKIPTGRNRPVAKRGKRRQLNYNHILQQL